VYQQVWKEAASGHPAFVITTGDTIQGTDADDEKAAAEWEEAAKIWQPYRRFPLYLVPGNHDIFSPFSERLFRKYSGHPPHYSFDYAGAHFTVLDNSRSDELPAAELTFLEEDLKAHTAAPVKMIFSHRPSWIVAVALHNPEFPLHRIAKQYGVQYVIAGHVHQMLHFEMEGITYVSMPSSGGHLRLSHKYEDGWFFGHARVAVTGHDIDFQIEELKAPHGQGRVTKAKDWGMAGLVVRQVGALVDRPRPEGTRQSYLAAGGSRSAGMAAR
jgi:UDP-2,3-diacylglucosamine pyrophosphatase LpxH